MVSGEVGLYYVSMITPYDGMLLRTPHWVIC
jgi:hypothetical protein